MCYIIWKALFKNYVKNVGQEMYKDKFGQMEYKK